MPSAPGRDAVLLHRVRAALVIASASDPCDGTFRLELAAPEFLSLGGCAALLRGTRRLRAHGGFLCIEHPQVPVRRVLHRGLAGAHNVGVG